MVMQVTGTGAVKPRLRPFPVVEKDKREWKVFGETKEKLQKAGSLSPETYG